MWLAFYMRTERTAAELMELYKAGPQDVFESSKLELIDAQKLLNEDDPTFLYVSSCWLFIIACV